MAKSKIRNIHPLDLANLIITHPTACDITKCAGGVVKFAGKSYRMDINAKLRSKKAKQMSMKGFGNEIGRFSKSEPMRGSDRTNASLQIVQGVKNRFGATD